MDKIVDTKDIQVQSVINFMFALGFDEFNSPRKGFYNTRDKHERHGMEFISYETAIKLHNHFYFDNHGRHCFRYPFDWVDTYTFNQAQAAKIVKRVKIQYSRKRGIVCQSSVVEFVDPAYYDLFLKHTEEKVND